MTDDVTRWLSCERCDASVPLDGPASVREFEHEPDCPTRSDA
jgi:hypothetical protein